MGTSTEELKARMKQLKFPSSDESGSFSPTPSPGGSLASRTSRTRPSLVLPLDSSFGLTSPITRRQNMGAGAANLNAPLSRDRLRLGTFPQPLQDDYERKLEDIMKLTGVLNIEGVKYKTPIGDLEALGDLGNGTCGHVVKMRHKESGKIIACKQMRRTGNSEETKRIVMDMDVVLKSHDCKEIVVCLGCFITASDVWICMELMATCFDKLLKQLKAPVPENICGKVAVATLNALNYLKDRHGVIHRDVKPSNILLDYEGKVKLCDFGISGRLVDSKAKTRSAGCAAYMAPERINPPNPNKPDYDIRADVWSLGITLVELATGQFPYKDCKTEFEVLTKVIQDDPPCLPQNKGFSIEFRQFVHDCLLKNHKDRPKYKKLLEHPFIIKYRDMDVDVGSWYSRVANHSGDPNKAQEQVLSTASANHSARKSSLEQRHEAAQQSFKPQPSPRMVKSWRMQNVYNSSPEEVKPVIGGGQEGGAGPSSSSTSSSSYHRLKFYPTSPSSYDSGVGGGFVPELNLQKPTSPRSDDYYHPHHHLPHHHHHHASRLNESTSPRFESSRMQSEANKSYDHSGGTGSSSRYYDSSTAATSRSNYLDSSNRMHLNGSLSRNNVTSSYHGSSASSYLSRPTYINSRSQEDYSSSSSATASAQLKSPQPKRYEKFGSYSETNSPRDYGHTNSGGGGAVQRKYSFETLDAHKDYTYTPKGTRKYESSYSSNTDHGHTTTTTSPRKLESPRKTELCHDSSQWQQERSERELAMRGGPGRDAGSSVMGRKYPPLPDHPPSSRGRETARGGGDASSTNATTTTSSSRSNFIPSLKFPSWTLSSPLSFRRFRTSSSTERPSDIDRSRRLQPAYRSLNERDKQFYSSSGRSDKL